MSAPPAVAPKQIVDFVHLPAFPATGPQILTIVKYEYLPEYINPFDNPPKPAFPAIAFTLGAETAGGIGFVAALPTRYSLHEKATYPKLYKMATGKEALAGTTPDAMIGKGISANVENIEKVSKKGTKYTRSQVGGFSVVHPKLVGEITPLAKLLPALTAILAKSALSDKADKPATNDNANPF